MKVVLDTNVIVAGFGTRGLCEDVVRVSLSRHELFLSEPILAEVSENLASKFKLPLTRVREIITLLRELAQVVVPIEVPTDACRDVKDLVILGTAIAANADCLVSGDADLLVVGVYRGIRIITPREFHDFIE